MYLYVEILFEKALEKLPGNFSGLFNAGKTMCDI